MPPPRAAFGPDERVGPLGLEARMSIRLLVLALGTLAIGTSAFVIAGILPIIAHELDVSVPAAGQLITLYALAYAISTPFLAVATGNLPRRPVLLGAML